ncbi:MAG: hypothetical protein B7Z73_05425 [Planctomycetia bacterium 21-64-5]|nr:MAG: hypothetical protein B7Z73_05425 [Planctomycetia bacterium 21-64-5]
MACKRGRPAKGAGQRSEQISEFDCPFWITELGARFDRGEGAFLDTAAIIPNLDLVITSDTAMAHLAGATAIRA